MSILKSLQQRRSYYNINKNLPISTEEVKDIIAKATELVPDAFNMKSSYVVTAFGKEHDRLWDAVYEVFGGQVPKEKIDSFKSGAGTVLYFYDEDIVKGLQERFPLYAENFPTWANHAGAMLQITIWSALREQNIGASLQHYNPIIDEKVKELFHVPAHYKLIAQMPFGGIGAEPDAKEKEDISKRVKFFE